MRKSFLSGLFAILLLNSPVFAAVDFEFDNSENLSQADGLSTDISGANQPMSVCAWFKMESQVANNNEVIYARYEFSTGNRSVFFAIDTGANGIVVKLSISETGAGVTASGIGATAVTQDVWTHGCGVYNDTDIRVYKDGVLDSNGASNPAAYTAGIFSANSPTTIGSYLNGSTPNRMFDGVISDVCVWDSALTASEVALIYNSKIKGICRQVQSSNLQLYCALDDCPQGTDNCSTDFVCSPGSPMTPTNTPSGSPEEVLSYP